MGNFYSGIRPGLVTFHKIVTGFFRGEPLLPHPENIENEWQCKKACAKRMGLCASYSFHKEKSFYMLRKDVRDFVPDETNNIISGRQVFPDIAPNAGVEAEEFVASAPIVEAKELKSEEI